MLNLFLLFQNKVLPLLKNVNDKVSYNDKDEVVYIMYAVTKISNTITHYASHRICSNVQFSDIDKIMQSMKTYPSIVYMVPDHKQKVFQMRYHNGKVDYFGMKAEVCLA